MPVFQAVSRNGGQPHFSIINFIYLDEAQTSKIREKDVPKILKLFMKFLCITLQSGSCM